MAEGLRHQSIGDVNTGAGSLAVVGTFYGDVTLTGAPDPKAAKEKAIADCRSRLFLTDPEVDRATLITAKGKRVPGTCEWIRDEHHYQQWQEGEISLLWIRGGPGKGKTMLSVFLVEELKQKGSVLSYFCTSGDEKRNNAVAVLRSVLWQITDIHSDLAEHFLEHFGRSQSDDDQRRAEATVSSAETLWMAFTAVCCDPKVGELVFILDGLDECDQGSRDWLASKLCDLQMDSERQSRIPPKIIVVSRDIPRLRQCSTIRLDPDHDRSISKDIESFVSLRVQELWNRGGFDEKCRQRVESSLLERSEGTFLWVGFAMAELLKKQTVLEVEQCLADLPSGLDAFYDRMLRQIATENADQVATLLKWIVLSVRPLSLSELAVAMQCKATTLRSAEEVANDLVTLCQPFVVIQSTRRNQEIPGSYSSIREDESSNPEELAVNLIHQSARDFFNSTEMPTIFQFPEEGHFEIAWKCLDQIQNCADTYPQLAKIRSGQSEVYAKCLRSNPIIGYAIEHWPAHARKAESYGAPLLVHPSGFFGIKSTVREWWRGMDHHQLWQYRIKSHHTLHMSAYVGFLPWIRKVLAYEWWCKVAVKASPATGWLQSMSAPLVLAGERGHGAALQVLLKHGAYQNLNAAFYTFIQGGYETAVRACLDHEPKLVAGHWLGVAPLHEAARRGRWALVKLLLDTGAEIDAENHCEGTPLCIAAAHGSLAVVQLLTNAGANVNAGKQSPLIGAAGHGHVEIVRHLLESGADIEAKDRCGRSSLQLAYGKGHSQVVKTLLDHGASCKRHMTLCMAASCGDKEEVMQLLDDGVSVDATAIFADGKMTALYCAACGGHDAVVRLLLDRGADPMALASWDRLGHGRSVMHIVFSRFAHDKCLDRLLQLCSDCGADINAGDDMGWTPLHLAAQQAQDSPGWVPPNLLASSATVENSPSRSIQSLVDHGAELDTQNANGWTALHVAATRGFNSVAPLLLSCGAQIDARDHSGSTPLHVAAVNRRTDTTILLLDRGADINARDNEGLTPLNHAYRAREKQNERALRSRGAVLGRPRGMKQRLERIGNGLAQWLSEPVFGTAIDEHLSPNRIWRLPDSYRMD